MAKVQILLKRELLKNGVIAVVLNRLMKAGSFSQTFTWFV
jgi:hypothetical protein